MYETVLSFSICLVDSILGIIYTGKFLKEKYGKKLTLIMWMLLYFFGQTVVFKLFRENALLGHITGVAIDIFLMYLIQSLLFYTDMPKQLFAIFSFTAGKEIVKYLVFLWLMIMIGDIEDKISTALLEKNVITTLEQARRFVNIENIVAGSISVGAYAVICTLYLKIIGKKFIRKDYQLQTCENIFLIFPGIMALAISVTMKMMIISVEDEMPVTIYNKVPATQFWVPLICILLLGMIVSSVILFQKLVQLSEERKLHVILENQIYQMQREIDEIQDIYADMRGLRHDMRSHLGNITAYVRKSVGETCEELADYIEKMEETINRLDFSCQTGNPITDIIIQQKIQEAAKKDIKFKTDFTYPAKQQIDAYDIGIILNNALENALEACEKVKGSREIYLHSFLKGNLFFIEIRNDFSGVISMNKQTGLPESNKKDGQAHGIGMLNILRCAKKYMGDMDVAVVETEGRRKFQLTIMMNGKGIVK